MPHLGCRPKRRRTMTPDQATELGKRVINTMRPTPALIEWQEVLWPLEFDDALVVFRQLRGDTDTGLSIARFMAAYRGRLAARTQHRAEHEPPPTCELCDSSGWIASPPERAHHPSACTGTPGGDSCWCTAMEPCRCTHGRAAASVHQRIARANGWQPASPDRDAPLTEPRPYTPSLLGEF